MVEIVIELEKVLKHEIVDAELEGVHTLRDLARVIQRRVQADSDQKANAIDLVLDAARKVPWCRVQDVALDARLMDAVDPDRWNRQ